jgi:hypothetical protein
MVLSTRHPNSLEIGAVTKYKISKEVTCIISSFSFMLFAGIVLGNGMCLPLNMTRGAKVIMHILQWEKRTGDII